MVTTRSSGNPSSNPKQNKKPMAGAGTKRKEHATSPQSNHGPKVAKKQTTIEEALGGEQKQDVHEDAEMKDAPDHNGIKDLGPNGDDKNGDNDKRDVTSSSGSTGENDKDENNSGVKDATQKEKGRSEGDNQEPEATDTPGTATDNAIEKSPSREKSIASNILEKGIIYFFTRNRVGIEDSDSVGDLQRTYFVLRPTPTGAKLGDGAIPDQQNNRLFALPKKSFPKSHHDRFMAFVERAKAGVEELKEDFFKGSQYETKTAGTRQQQPVIPVGEGVYAITRTEDRSTHLAYAITIPTELGEIQEDLGLRSQGSFQISVKNPERSGPANANLPKGPEFPKEIIEEFRGLAWAEVKPEYLDYANCQILLIGEDPDKALKQTRKDQKQGKEPPKNELEQLEHEDELRVEHLHGNDTVFDDLNLSKKEYPQVPTTW